MLSLCLELLVLCACASLCASFVVIPTNPSATPQELQGWRRLSDAATAAAVAAAEEVAPSPSRQTAQAVRLAARAATAATAAALGSGPSEPTNVVSSSVGGEAASAEGTSGRGAVEQGQGPALQGPGGVGARGRCGAGHASGGTRGGLGGARGALRCPRSSAGRKSSTSIPLGDKIALIDIKDAGHSWSQTLEMFRLNVSLAAARNIYEKRDDYKRRAAASEDMSSPRLRRSYFELVSQGLWDWYKTLQRVGGRHLLVSGSLLEGIATELGVTG